MTTYTIHIPDIGADIDSQADQARLVPDGFSWGAMFFGPIWMACHRAWTGVLLWVLGLAITGGLVLWGLSLTGAAVMLLFAALLSGLEGQMLRARSLRRRGFRAVDLVSGTTAVDAEQTFLRRWTRRTTEETVPRTAVYASGLQASDQVVGLFPDSGG
jgi:hypothetical protein